MLKWENIYIACHNSALMCMFCSMVFLVLLISSMSSRLASRPSASRSEKCNSSICKIAKSSFFRVLEKKNKVQNPQPFVCALRPRWMRCRRAADWRLLAARPIFDWTRSTSACRSSQNVQLHQNITLEFEFKKNILLIPKSGNSKIKGERMILGEFLFSCAISRFSNP